MNFYYLCLNGICLLNVSYAQEQIGGNIAGEKPGDRFGSSVSMSRNGSMVAIGAPSANGARNGYVHVYSLTEATSLAGATWIQVGGDIDGESWDDESGSSVSLSGNGKKVAIRAKYNDGTNRIDSGHVRVYSLDEATSLTGSRWGQVGIDIDGKAEYDESGSSVSLSADGTMVAIGAMGSNNVRVF